MQGKLGPLHLEAMFKFLGWVQVYIKSVYRTTSEAVVLFYKGFYVNLPSNENNLCVEKSFEEPR